MWCGGLGYFEGERLACGFMMEFLKFCQGITLEVLRPSFAEDWFGLLGMCLQCFGVGLMVDFGGLPFLSKPGIFFGF